MKNPIILFGLAAGVAIAQTPSTQTKEVQKQIHVITAQTGAVSVSSSGTAADTMVSPGGRTIRCRDDASR